MDNSLKAQEETRLYGSVHNERVALLLTILVTGSGVTAISYEILYLRALTTLLGDVLTVHATVTACFLIGIGVGARLSPRVRGHLNLVEVSTGLQALVVALLWPSLTTRPELATLTGNSSYLLLTCGIFCMIPSLSIGLSLPLFTDRIARARQVEGSFDRAYGFHGFGAFLSVLLVEFWLIREVGLTRCLAACGFTNLLIGASLSLLDRQTSAVASAGLPTAVTTTVTAAEYSIRRSATENERTADRQACTESAGWERLHVRRIMLALAVASFASTVFQMFFLKLIYLVFHPHRENFAIGLAITFLGLSLGTAVVGRWKFTLQGLMSAAPLAIGAVFSLYHPILILYGTTRPGLEVPGMILLHKLLIAALFGLGPAILFSATIPALVESSNSPMEYSSQLLFVSGVANALGALAYVLVLHEWMPGAAVLLLVGGLAILASLIGGPAPSRRQKSFILAGAASLLTMTTQIDEPSLYLALRTFELDEGDEVFIHKAASESATLVRTLESEILYYNGHISIEIQEGGVINAAEVLVGLIPARDAPRRGRALLIGFGSGITAGTMGCVFDQVDVVEINPAFYEMMGRLSHANLGVENNSRVKRHIGDGRAFLNGKDAIYDAIVVSGPAPRYYAAGKLYTREFYELARRALKPDGVIGSWISLGDMSEPGIFILLKTLGTVFPHGRLYRLRDGYYQMTASPVPYRPGPLSDLSPFEPRLARELEIIRAGKSLDAWLEDRTLSRDLFGAFEAPDAPFNLDDRPQLEFLTVRYFDRGQFGEDPFEKSPGLFSIEPRSIPEPASTPAPAPLSP